MNCVDLFKYYAPEYDGQSNIAFHTKGSIYFQTPDKFNDPWDYKAPIITCPSDKRLVIEILSKLEKRGHLPTSVKQSIKGMSSDEISQWLVENFKESYEKLRSLMGVFSLSFIPDSELMWSHYASSHFGYMLHFQIDLDAFKTGSRIEGVGLPIPVIYSNEKEVWDLEDYDDVRKRYAYDLIRYKSEAWKYECELRLLNTDRWGFIKTPSNWIKSIVIGINIEDKLRGELEDIGKSIKIPVLSAKMNEREYKVDIPNLQINGEDGRRCYEEVIKSEEFRINHIP
jgi:hypothetical protein